MKKELKINEGLLLDWETYLEQQLNDPEFKKAFEAEMLRLKIAQLFRKRRAKLRISQVKLAKMAQTDQKVISRIENGATSVWVDLLHKVATALWAKIDIRLESC